MQEGMQPEQAKPGPGGASQLVADIHSKMTELMDLMDQSPAITPEDKQAFGQVIQTYRSFVENNLAQGAGKNAPKPQPQPMRGPAPVDAGAREVQPAL